MAKVQMCILEEGKICDGCGECDRCDLDPNKLCDNCMKCVNQDHEYRAILVDDIAIREDENKPV